jgi:hypothetical protein
MTGTPEIMIGGDAYLRDSKGNLAAKANIRPADLLMDQTVGKMMAYALDLSAELARFRAHSMADIAAFDALLAQEYGLTRDDGGKGNRTFTSFDGCRQVKISVADRIVLGPELQIAKKLLDEAIIERSGGADPFLVTLVNRAFRVDQEGKVDVASILALRRLQVDDPRWPDITRAIDDSIRTVGTKTYVRFYTRATSEAAWRLVPLDLATTEPTPEAFARRSLRRTVEDARALAERANHLLCQDHFSRAQAVVEQLQALLGGGISPTPRAAAGLADEEAA